MKNKKNCIFCKIIEKKVHTETIFENKKIVSFFDNKPISKGHVLIVTKIHFENLTFINNESWNDIFEILKKVFEMLDEKFSPKGYNFISNIGENAYQTINHVHFHIIPKYEKDKGFICNF